MKRIMEKTVVALIMMLFIAPGVFAQEHPQMMNNNKKNNNVVTDSSKMMKNNGMMMNDNTGMKNQNGVMKNNKGAKHQNGTMKNGKGMMNHNGMMMNNNSTMKKNKGTMNSIVRMGIIDVKSIDKNKDGKVYQDMMDWNVISDKPGKCPNCGMTLKEVTVTKAIHNLKKHGFKVK